jgi:hypothetical protein
MTAVDSVAAVPDHLPTILVGETEAVFSGFCSTNRDVLAFLHAADDPEQAAQDALTLGCRALLGAAARADGTTLAQAMEHATALVDRAVSDTEGRFNALAGALFGDDGMLPRTVDDLRAAVTAALSDAFDPDRRDSALARLTTLLSDLEARQLHVLRRALDPTDESGPLGILLMGLREQHREQMDAVARLAADHAAAQAEELIWNKTAIKGQAYEQWVMSAIANCAATWEDVAIPVGRERGVQGSMTGDILVDVRNAGRYVIEVKSTRLALKKALGELRKAVDNHEAAAGIIVFATEDQCPAPGVFTTYGDLAVLVLPQDGSDGLATRVACAWARARVISKAETLDATNAQVLLSDVADIERAMQRVTDAKKALGGAARHISQAGQHVEDLRDEVERSLARLRQNLA